MDQRLEYMRSAIGNFKLESCCFLVPIRIGVTIIGYINVFAALMSLIGTANGSFSPTLMRVKESILADDESITVCLFAYATELGASVLLLSAIYRKDIILLRVYMYYCIATLIMTIMLYSMVIAGIDIIIKLLIIISSMYHCYTIMLIRSAIVEIRLENKAKQNGVNPVTIDKDRDTALNTPTDNIPDVEAPEVNERTNELNDTHNEGRHETTLETVPEHPSEGNPRQP